MYTVKSASCYMALQTNYFKKPFNHDLPYYSLTLVVGAALIVFDRLVFLAKGRIRPTGTKDAHSFY